MIIRLVEELLSVSRTLKESWLLNQMPQKLSEEEPVDNRDANEFSIIKSVMETILQSAKLDGELSEGEDGEQEERIQKEEEQQLQDVNIFKEEQKDETKEGANIELSTNDHPVKVEDEKTSTGEAVITGEAKEESASKNENGTSQQQQEDVKIEDSFNYGNGNNTIDNISNDLNDYNLTNYGNDNLDGLDFDNFGAVNDEDENPDDIIMLD
jgi:hypothetical protein